MAYTYAGQFGPEAVISNTGAPVPDASVTVYNADGTTLSTLYTDRTKGSTAGNPVLTDGSGNLEFWAEPGQHVLKFTAPGVSRTITITVPSDPAEDVASATRGQPNGVASLDGAGAVPSAQLANGVQTVDGLHGAVDLSGTYPTVFVVDAPTGVAATDTAAINAKVNAAKTSIAATGGAATVVLRAGTYLADGIVCPTKMTIRGQGRNVTMIRAVTGSSNKAVLLLDTDNVNGLCLSDFQVLPAATPNAGQHGIWFKTVTGASGTGVLDQGTLTRISCGSQTERFAGNALWLCGGGTSALNPIQWMVLDQVQTYASTTGKGLVISGQVGQTTVRNGFHVGPGVDTTYTQYGGAGASIWIGPQLNDDGTFLAYSTPYAIALQNVSAQSNNRAIDVNSGSVGIVVECPHFEATGHCVTATGGAAVAVIGGDSTDGGHNTAGGTAFLADSQSLITVQGHRFVGTTDRHYDGLVFPQNNYINAGVALSSQNSTGNVSIDGTGAIELGLYSTALVNTSATHLTTVKSRRGVGESVFLRAFSGTIVLDWGGTSPDNLVASGLTFPYTVPQDAIVHLVRTDLAGGWNVVSVTH